MHCPCHVCQSFAIAFILTLWVHCFTILLDRNIYWETTKWIRMLLQVIICWGVPCILACVMANIYFHNRGVDIEHTDYKLLELPLINVLLLFLNYYYYHKYKSIKDKYQLDTLSRIIEQSNPKEESEILPNLIIPYNDNLIKLNAYKDVACFYKAEDGYWIKTLQGNCYPYTLSIIQIEKIYGGSHFFKLNRALIISRKVIKGYSTQKDGHLLVEMFSDIGSLEHNSANDLFSVSSKHAEEFKKWFDSGA